MKKSELFFAFLLLPIDIGMIFLSFVLAYQLRVSLLDVLPALSDITLKQYLHYSLVIIPIWIVLFALNGLYYRRATGGVFHEFYKVLSASSTAMLFLVLIFFFSKTVFFSRLILIFTWVLSIILICLGRIILKMIQRYLLRYGIGRRNLLLIGDNQTSETVCKTVSKNPSFGYEVIGILNGESNISKFGLNVIGPVSDLLNKIRKYHIDEIVLTDISLSKTKTLEIIQICSDTKTTFKYIPDTFSLMTFNVTSGLLGSIPVMELKSIPLDGWGRIVKRLIDILFSAVMLIVTSPVMLVVAILEKLTSPGPIFFKHERVGRDEKIFNFYKFRSMYIDKCDFKGGVFWSTKADETTRITPLGRVLRKTNIDELPQFWNILIGDMSLIGPRPELPKHVERFENEIPDYFKRHKVKAGLTGWAQVNGLKGDTSIKERVRYDIFYIENWSLWFDLKIVFKTIGLLIYEIFGGKYEYRTRP